MSPIKISCAFGTAIVDGARTATWRLVARGTMSFRALVAGGQLLATSSQRVKSAINESAIDSVSSLCTNQ